MGCEVAVAETNMEETPKSNGLSYTFTSAEHATVKRREGNVLFSDALQYYIYGYMASDSESENLLPPHTLFFPISSKGSFIYTPSHRQDSTNHGLCYTSRGALAGTKNSSMGPP